MAEAAPKPMTTRFQHAYILNVLSDDHPGIVASVGIAIQRLEGNIDACSETVIQGYFTLIMIVSLPQPIDPDELAEAVAITRKNRENYQVVARKFLPPPASHVQQQPVERFVLTAHGRDRQDILLCLTQYLAGKDINILDLFVDRPGEDFVLISQVEIPRRWNLSDLRTDLEEIARENGFDIHLQHENVFVATNQLRLRPAKPGSAQAL